MNFGANKTSIEIIKKGAVGGIFFRDFYFSVKVKSYKKSWKQFDQLKNIDKKY